jgi:argininosuccinate lyase
MTAMWRGVEVRRDRFASELVGDFALATELADALVQRGVPFRDAHEAVARMVRWCEERGGNLSLLDHGQGTALHRALPEELGDLLDPHAAVARRTSRGGTCWPEVERQVELLRQMLPGS